jgi:Cu+-exporting ATPase
VGDRVRVRPGEPVPVDGRVLEGRAFLDRAALTGESQPAAAEPGARVLAGAVALDGALLVEAEAVGGGRVRDEVERLLEEALGRRGGAVRLADRLAAVLMPVALFLALGTFAATLPGRGLEAASMAALAVVLVSCPCALGIATPLAFWTALGAAWRRGVLVRGADVLEGLARVRRVALDKTGTLTRPQVELVGLSDLDGLEEDAALARAAALEAHSEHPIAAGVRRAWAARPAPPALPAVHDLQVLPGVGVAGTLAGARWELRRDDDDEGETTRVALREDGRRRAVLHLAAALEPEAPRAVARLRLGGLEPRVLTGDGPGPARALERQLGIPVEASLLPADKVARLEALGPRVAYVGDGLNDAAALAAADVGIALAHGSPRSLAVADVTLLGAGLEAVPALLRLARRALSTARLNLAWATGYNLVGWWLAATGRLTPVAAAAAMVASSAAVVLGSRRADRWDAAPTRSGGSSSPAPRSDGSPAPLPNPGPGA